LILILTTSFVEHTFGPDEPELKQNRILTVSYFKIKFKGRGRANGPMMSYWFMEKYAKSMKTPETVALASFHKNVVCYKDNCKYQFALKHADAEFWQVYNFNFLAGRGFQTNEVQDAQPVAVITKEVAQSYFGNQEAVGDYIDLEGQNFRVVGIIQNISLLRIFPYADIWVPITTSKNNLTEPILVSEEFPGYFAVLLAHDHNDFPKIKAEFQKNLNSIDLTDTRFEKIYGGAESYIETISRMFAGSFETPNISGLMLILLILLLLFLLLPTINLVNINISRIMERSSEIGIRKAFGAARRTLIGQFIIENIIITIMGGIISAFLALILIRIINQSEIIPHLHLSFNWRVFYKSLVLCLFFGFLSGVFPAYKMSKMQPAAVLRGGDL
jgi:putative ABC transport system permease protein